MKHKRLLCLIVLLAGAVSCNKKEKPKVAEMVPEVTVLRAVSRNVPLTKEFVGQVAGFRDIEVRARIGGILLKRFYTEGAEVKEGQPLFLIDPEPFKVAVSQALSVVRIEQARFENAKRALERTLPLYKENAVSQKDRDDAIAYHQGAKASLETARAKLKNAQIDLGYTTVTAPISGFTSAETVSEGSLIVPNSDKSLLTVISQVDPAYVNFSYSENEMLMLRKGHSQGTLSGTLDKLKVRLKMGDSSMFSGDGKLNFNDIIVDSSTGTIRARAVFPNSKNILKPGQFVRVYVEGFELKNSFMIPQRSVIFTQQGPIVFVVDSKSVAQQVSVELGQELGNDVFVSKGLKNGDWVIVDGAAKVKQGQQVKIVKDRSMAKADLLRL
ncbi:Efflux pump periplasmic linker BepD precursor [compost metagenome]